MNINQLDICTETYIPTSVKSVLTPFKEHDLVYCPYFLEGKPFEVKVNEEDIEPFDSYEAIYNYDYKSGLYIEYGMEKLYFDSYGLHERFGYIVFKVTYENREALNTLYPNIDFF